MTDVHLQMMKDLSSAFLKGEIEAVAAHFVTPLAVYVGEQLMVLTNAEMLRSTLQSYHAATTALGVTSASPRMAAVDLPRGRNRSVWVEWTLTDARGKTYQGSQTNFILTDPMPRHGPIIEMVTYSRVAFPDLVGALPFADQA